MTQLTSSTKMSVDTSNVNNHSQASEYDGSVMTSSGTDSKVKLPESCELAVRSLLAELIALFNPEKKIWLGDRPEADGAHTVR